MRCVGVRRIIAFMLMCAAVLLLCSCKKTLPEPLVSENDGLKIEILSTGKSDCIIICIDDEVIVIDTADVDDGAYISERLRAYGITKIDHLILTHYDKDHIGSAVEILNNFAVERIIAPDFSDTSDLYALLMNAVSRKGTELIRPNEDMFFEAGEGEFWINVPSEPTYKDENNYSLITTLSYGSQKFVFMGDALKARTQEYYDRLTTDADGEAAFDYALVKLPHHGDYYKVLTELLSVIDPTYAVITANSREIETKYNDATVEEKLVQALETLQIEFFVTCDGSIRLFCDGTDVEITQ